VNGLAQTAALETEICGQRLGRDPPRKVLSTPQSGRKDRLYPHRSRKCRLKSRRQAIADEVEEFKQLRSKLVSLVEPP
jgi:hypothetical protein